MSQHIRNSYNNMIGDSVSTITSGTVTVPNNTSNGLYWGLNGTSNTISTDPNIKGSTLQVKGDADFDGDKSCHQQVAAY